MDANNTWILFLSSVLSHRALFLVPVLVLVLVLVLVRVLVLF
jgi:hypothetical protein